MMIPKTRPHRQELDVPEHLSDWHQRSGADAYGDAVVTYDTPDNYQLVICQQPSLGGANSNNTATFGEARGGTIYTALGRTGSPGTLMLTGCTITGNLAEGGATARPAEQAASMRAA